MDKNLNEQKDTFWPCRSRSFFIELLFILNAMQKTKVAMEVEKFGDSKEEELVKKISAYLNENLAKKITIEEISKEFFVNRNLINQYFTKVTGKTVINYLIQLRIRFATSLLSETEIPIEEVAYRCGYEDISYFNKVFKMNTNKTPKELRIDVSYKE